MSFTTFPSPRATASRRVFTAPARRSCSTASRSSIANVEIDDIYVGNGVSELVVMGMQGLLENGDEVLIPAPDYPLWTAATYLCGGRPVHYRCDESAGWAPDSTTFAPEVTSRTRAMVIINPNNPTGRRLPERRARGHARSRQGTRSGRLRRRDLRQDPLRRCRLTYRWPPSPTIC